MTINVSKALAFVICFCSFLIHTPSEAQTTSPTPPAFLSISINNRNNPWPDVPFGNLRLWDSGVRWNTVNTSRGGYNWSALDAWVALAQTKGKDLVYTFGSTPVWASTNKYQTGCAYGDGTCAPPNWTDWEDFVGTLVSRYKGRIKYYELWNEPNDLHYWTGSMVQMVELSRRAANLIRGIDPSAVILSPAPTWTATTAWAWLDSYLAAGAGTYFDVVAFHAYTGNQKAESTFSIVDNLKAVMSKYGISGRQMWVTEGGWGRNSVFSTVDAQAGFLAQRLLLTWSRGGVHRYYWYQWDNPGWGTLWTSSGGTNKAGIAFREVYKWMVGSTMTSLCTQNSTTYTWICGFTRPDGTRTMALWNAVSSRSFTVPAGYDNYQDLAGGTYTVSSTRTVTIGYKPILLTGGTATTACEFTGMGQPSVKICTPTNGGTTSTSLRVQALAADSKAVSTMQIYVDGVKKYEKFNSARVDTTLTVNTGSRNIKVQAINSAGTAYSSTVIVTAN